MYRPRRLMAGIACAVMIVAACEPQMVPVDPANLPAQPNLACIAVPPSVCQQMLADARASAPQGAFLVQVLIKCTRPAMHGRPWRGGSSRGLLQRSDLNDGLGLGRRSLSSRSTGRDRGQHVPEGLGEQRDLVGAEDERRPDLEHVP